MEKASNHVEMDSIRRLGFFGEDVNTRRPLNSSCGSGSVVTMFAGNNSWSSTNFPATIWLTSFAGTRENPGPTTNG